MARLKRLVAVGHPHVVSLKTVASEPAYRDADDARLLLATLARFALEHDIEVHAFALTPPGLQMLATPYTPSALSSVVQAMGRLYVNAFNRRHHRSGTLWGGRFQCAPVEASTHFLICARYIEQAPSRLGSPAAPADYEWSSASHRVGQRQLSWLAAHDQFWRLGNTPFERDARYAALLAEPLSPVQIAEVERHVLKGWALGSPAFAATLSEQGRRAMPLERGRRAAAKKGAAQK